MTTIVFSHGNSFPAGTYRVLLDSLRERGFSVRAIDKYGHDPSYPVSKGWPHLVRQLSDFVNAQADTQGPPVLVGHSLGGILSLMCASRHPELAQAVVLLDAPIVTGWRASAIDVARRTTLARGFFPSTVSRKRREHWSTPEEALEHFRKKRVFAAWHPQVLVDYVEHGLTRSDDGWRLSFERDVESEIYDTLPLELGRQLRRHPLRCPLAFVGGLQSVEMRRTGGFGPMSRLARGRVCLLDGTHLLPMEKPYATAAAIESAIVALSAAGRTPEEQSMRARR